MTKPYNKKLNVYLITHCESCYNKRGVFTGRINSHLTENGIKHAKMMAVELKNKPIDLAIHTSLARTKETLEQILKYHPHCRIEVDDRMIERDYGDLSRKSKSKYQKDHPDLYPVYHRSYDVRPPNGESIKDVERRVLPFLKELLNRIKREHHNVLVVCHGNSIRPMIRYFENLSAEKMMKLEYLRHHIFHYQIDTTKEAYESN